MANTDAPKCQKSDCTSGLPASIGFVLDGSEDDVLHCSACIADGIKNRTLMRSEIDSIWATLLY